MPVMCKRFAPLFQLQRLVRHLLGVAALLAATTAHAGLSRTDAGPLSTAMFSGLTSSHTYTPSTGETLGRIVAKTLPNSPLSEDLLVQAFVSLNPQAFSTGKNSRTLSAAALKVPNHNQLLQLVLFLLLRH